MNLEFRILDAINSMHTPVGDWLMCFVTRLGDAGFIWILLAAVLIVIPQKRKSGVILLAGLCVDMLLCNVMLKHLVGRIRPCEVNQAIELLIARPHDFSFPSGHTAASFTAVTALYLAGEKKLWKPTLVLAVLIAFSRLYLYVHYPTDIVGGILCGVCSAFVGAWVINWVMRKGMAKWLL